MAIPSGVIAKAATQGGFVTRQQLLALGLSESAIDRRLAAGDLEATVPAVYRLFPSSEHADLIRGAVLALPAAVASHQSAAHLLAFPRLPALTATVTVPSHTTHAFPGVVVRRGSDLVPAHLTTVERIPITNVARTVFDLASVVTEDVLDLIADELVIAGRLKIRHLERIVEQVGRRGKPGTTKIRAFLEARSGPDQDATVLERRGRAALAAAGLPAPTPQYPIPWDRRRRFDDAYPDARLAIEWDSLSWHSQQRTMESDRARDREAAVHSWFVVRFTWRDVTERPGEVAATVARLLQTRR